MGKLKLFAELIIGTRFHFGDNPIRKLIKDGPSHYIAPEGRHKTHPHVAVIQDPPKYVTKSIWDKGESDEGER